jgi:hypothetical protein
MVEIIHYFRTGYTATAYQIDHTPQSSIDGSQRISLTHPINNFCFFRLFAGHWAGLVYDIAGRSKQGI